MRGQGELGGLRGQDAVPSSGTCLEPGISFLFGKTGAQAGLLTPLLCFAFGFVLAAPMACGSSWARDRTHATAATQTTAVTMANP